MSLKYFCSENMLLAEWMWNHRFEQIWSLWEAWEKAWGIFSHVSVGSLVLVVISCFLLWPIFFFFPLALNDVICFFFFLPLLFFLPLETYVYRAKKKRKRKKVKMKTRKKMTKKMENSAMRAIMNRYIITELPFPVNLLFLHVL